MNVTSNNTETAAPRGWPLHGAAAVDGMVALDLAIFGWPARSPSAGHSATGLTIFAILILGALIVIAIQRRTLRVLAEEREGVDTLEIEHAAIEEIVNSMDGIIREWDVTAHQFTFVSSPAEAILGYEAKAWLADPNLWCELLHPEDRWVEEHFHQLVEGGGPYDLQYRMIARDGRTVWIRETGLICRSMSADGHHLARGFMRDISAQKQAETELEAAHQKVVENSRRAGMAEVATGVLHNVGNVLNSVNVSGNLIVDRLKHSRVFDLIRVAKLVRENQGSLSRFVAEDPRGQILPDLLDAMAEQLVAEHGELLREVAQISDRIGHIKDIVSVQQSHARSGGLMEPHDMAVLVEDALKLNEHPLRRAGIEVVRDYDTRLPVAIVDGHGVLQILVNLIRNAVDAIEALSPAQGSIVVGVKLVELGATIRMTVTDNGIGIDPDHMDRIFSHGFTTKRDGHGFGLHAGAIAAAAMGGALSVESEGPGRGATFVFDVPVVPSVTKHPTFWRRPNGRVEV